MTPKVGKKFTREVSIALECLENVDSKWSRCKNKLCKLCSDDMTKDQKKAMTSTSTVLVFHMIMRKGNDCADIDKGHKYASLGEEWDDLHDSIPRMKYTRIITAEKQADGKFLLMCSCGFDFRYQGTCRHISMLLLHASDGVCAGCEIENIALRNTAAFAACRDATLIERAAFDWIGVICGHVTEESLNSCPCPCGEDDENEDDGGEDGGEDGKDRSEPRSRQSKRKSPGEIQLKARREAKMKEIQDHYYRVKAKLESCKMADFWHKADRVDGHILNAFRELGDVPDVAKTVVANRYPDDPKRQKRTADGGQRRPNKVAAVAGGGATAAESSMYAAIVISSDSEAIEALRNGGAPSDSD
jgi:hypothetical protein